MRRAVDTIGGALARASLAVACACLPQPEPDAQEQVDDCPWWHPDVDGDGFGAMFDGVQTCDAPPGRVDNAEDCYDGNSDARPDQTELFAIHRGDGSFDYDCDGHYRYESLEVGQCKTLPECPLMPGWDRGAPPCGEGGRLLTQCRPPSAGGMRRCEAEFQDAVQRCR